MPPTPFGPFELLVLLGGLGALVLWLKGPSRLPLRITVFLVAFAFSPVFPLSISLPLQIVALGIGFIEWARGGRDVKRDVSVVALTALIVAYWGLLIFHPNVPGIDAGAQGYQKSVLAISGIVLGNAIHSKYQKSVELLIIKLVIASLVTSIIAHFWFPALIGVVNRDADKYTATFGGVERLQGIYPGPFHVALACLVVITWSIYRWSEHRYISTIAITVGLIALYLSYVRTAYVALALVLVTGIVLSGSVAKTVKLVSIVLVSIVPLAIVFRSGATAVFDVVASIADFAEDGRFLSRIPGYIRGLELFSQSPYLGWGAGAAGDTLGDAFAGSEHVSPHNVALKILVEGGLVGLTLWVLLIFAVFVRINLRHPDGKLAVCLLVAVFGLGLTTASIEAVPPSYFVFVIVGLSLGGRKIYSKRTNVRYAQGLQRGVAVRSSKGTKLRRH